MVYGVETNGVKATLYTLCFGVTHGSFVLPIIKSLSSRESIAIEQNNDDRIWQRNQGSKFRMAGFLDLFPGFTPIKGGLFLKISSTSIYPVRNICPFWEKRFVIIFMTPLHDFQECHRTWGQPCVRLDCCRSSF